jgi:hypothetical protein
MANTFKVLARGNAALSASTLYTVPTATTTLVNNILVSNPTSSVLTYNLSFAGFPVAASVQLDTNDAAILDIKQVLSAGQTISAFASSSTVVFHISGLEIT